jgi:hypothetical protein
MICPQRVSHSRNSFQLFTAKGVNSLVFAKCCDKCAVKLRQRAIDRSLCFYIDAYLNAVTNLRKGRMRKKRRKRAKPHRRRIEQQEWVTSTRSSTVKRPASVLHAF